MSYIFQSELICAILAELDRQRPGICVDQCVMNAIIDAADSVVAAIRLMRDEEEREEQR